MSRHMDWRSGPQRVALVLGRRPTTLFVCAAVLVVACAALLGLGWRATTASRRSVEHLVERRADEKVALLAAALNQDMRGALNRILVPLTEQDLIADSPYDLLDRFSRAFARFPYPESFFAWHRSDSTTAEAMYVFTRADRPPSWSDTLPVRGRYPVVMHKGAGSLDGVLARLRAHAAAGPRFVVLETHLAGEPHQVVAHLMSDGSATGLFGIVGFTVSLPWVREHYFAELTQQLSSIGGSPDDLSLAILDDRGTVVTETSPRRARFVKTRSFPFVFVDTAIASKLPPGQPAFPLWTARASASGAGALAAAGVGAQRLFALIALAVAATLAALLLTTVAVRANAQLATMKSEFVSAVTHELKTPLAAIRLVADTLAKGRYETASTVTDYAHLLAKESGRLGRLIDNLLAYARVNDIERFYQFRPLHLADVIEDALDSGHERLAELGFDVEVYVEPDLPPVRGDRRALLRAIDNLVDNAVKYSGASRELRIGARRRGGLAELSVTDHGPGIPADDRVRVFERFCRGQTAASIGSGLGLTIAARIVAAHRGTIDIASDAASGTTVTLALPLAKGTS